MEANGFGECVKQDEVLSSIPPLIICSFDIGKEAFSTAALFESLLELVTVSQNPWIESWIILGPEMADGSHLGIRFTQLSVRTLVGMGFHGVPPVFMSGAFDGAIVGMLVSAFVVAMIAHR